MEKIDIAELLKDCPEGMELDCTTWENVTFEKVVTDKIYIKRNKKNHPYDNRVVLNQYGCTTNHQDEKCRIFPKGKTTWEGFQRPFKDGDILVYTPKYNKIKYTFIYKRRIDMHYLLQYCGWFSEKPSLGKQFNAKERMALYENDDIKFATEEEKQELFDAIKKNGYRWNAETNTLEKLTVPSTTEKFYIRIGDIPSEEKSSVHRVDAVVGYEEGVSVYDCVETDGLYRIVMPFPLKEGQGMTYECLIQEITQCRYEIEKPINVYLVSGIEVGKGHDNEPLIKDVKILKDLTEQFNAKNDNTEENKTLEKLVKPMFNIGDRIKRIKTGNIYEIIKILSNCYITNYLGSDITILFNRQDEYELVPNKFDINTLTNGKKLFKR